MPEHPRARTLRVAYLIMALVSGLVCVAVALLARDILAGVTGFALFSYGFALAVFAAGKSKTLPRGTAIGKSESKVLLWGLLLSLSSAVILLILAGIVLPAEVMAIPGLASILLGAFALGVAVR